MSIEKVKEYLKAFGVEDRIQEFDVSSATVELAAKALGTEGARIAKTLSFYGTDGCILVVAAGDARIDNSKFKNQFHIKAKMLSAEDVVKLTGHIVGGVCPFALDGNVKVYPDISLKRFETVYPAAGTANSAIKLTPEELYSISKAEQWVDVCKGWQ